MGVRGAGAGQEGGVDLRVSGQDLTELADDLDDMQAYLDKQIKRMDAIVDRIEAGWRGPAATAYRGFHRAADAPTAGDRRGHRQRGRQALDTEPEATGSVPPRSSLDSFWRPLQESLREPLRQPRRHL
ncbi:WXG100 family type VII secretion target [Streptomyces plumbiresistens]|uniref:WXG100 family type VII secretion target n=1 Tax=Streptomyces plumbiresistens TaxID=511811 RepID=A0ABP7QBG5_9ACTN